MQCFLLEITLLRRSEESSMLFQSSTVVVAFDQGRVFPAQTPWLGTQRIVMQMAPVLLRESEALQRVLRGGTNGC